VSTSIKPLLQAVDSLIEKYGSTNPELLNDLRLLKAELQKASAKRDAAKVAEVALRIATWARFIYDWMDDGP
jgi:hypothetical protein